MDTRPMTLIRTALLALCVVSGLTGCARHPTPYSIWWSPSLELESLDKIDERLERPLWPDENGFRLFVGIGSNRRTEIASSCADIRRLEKEASGAIASPDIYLWLVVYRRCVPIERFREAKPALKSYVNDFVLNAGALGSLPALLRLSPACEELCRLFDANHYRIPLTLKLRRPIDVIVTSGHEITVETDLDRIHIEILGRADFNADELEDLFVRSIVKAKEGRWGDEELFTLTRDEPDGVLWVLDAEDYVCSPESYHVCSTQ